MMKRLHHYIYILGLVLLTGCSTTSNLPEGEYLYTGIESINIKDKKGSLPEVTAIEEVEGALAYAPNNSLFGSSSMRTPLPVGLWVYNSMGGEEHTGFKKWVFDVFAATPRTISSAAPRTRVKVAQNVLQNYGYFQGTVNYRLIDQKNPRMQKIAYDVCLGPAYMLDTVMYDFDGAEDSIVRATLDKSYLRKGDQFSVLNLHSEKSRINTELHNNGFYYYRPDYIHYLADSAICPGMVQLLVQQEKNLPYRVTHPWSFGKVSAFIRKNGSTGSQNSYDDTLKLKRLTLGYQGARVPIKPRVMFRNFKFWTGGTYSEERVANTVTGLGNMGIFNNVRFSFTPRDTTDTCSVLDVRLDCTMDKLIDTELEFNFSQKSNSQIGPDASVTFTRRNAFRYGETLALKIFGSYYWQTQGRSSSTNMNALDTYLYGADASITYPWTVFPVLANKFTRYPTSTRFNVSFTRENVANAYRSNKFGVGVNYNYQTSKYMSHSFTPLYISLVDLREVSEDYSSNSQNKFSLLSTLLSSEYVPSIQYVLAYDNSKDAYRRWTTNFSATLKESGNIIAGIQSLAGKDFNEKGKNFVFNSYNQFVKIDLELRNQFRLSSKSRIATRASVGVMKAFGNSDATPASEWFYCGGANSIRAFPARSLGPGNVHYGKNDIYFYHGGDLKLELNAEYRFPLFANLYGALFVDAGNVWKHDNSGQAAVEDPYADTGSTSTGNSDTFSDGFSFSGLGRQLALGTGFGFRYDMEFLVLRFDVGIAIHAPYETGKSGYYNIPRFFKDGMCLNFAVGYPF